jgi:hypothetical protein
MNFFYKQALCVALGSACACAFADSGILPSWMRRFSGPSENTPSEKVITKEVVKEVVVKQLPPEIINLRIESKGIGPEVMVSGQVQANSAIHAILINGQPISHNVGSFNVSRQLVPGNNEFTVTAIDSRGLETKLKTAQVYIATNNRTNDGPRLQPDKIKKPSEYQDAVALIIGVKDYQGGTPSKFSDSDAESFKQYAITALKVPERRVKILLNQEATRINILRAVDLWLKSEVTANTRIYIFYSGHGLASSDGETGYLLPYDGDATYLSETAINLKLLFQRIELLKPRDVVAFLDSCYSGQTRGGGTLLADARPIAIQLASSKFGGEKTSIFSATSGIELAGSNERLGHGLFSFYLMKGLEGAAELNPDGTIDSGKLQEYIRRSVFKESALNGKPQNPEYIGRPILIN